MDKSRDSVKRSRVRENIFHIVSCILANCIINKIIYLILLIIEFLQIFPLYLYLGVGGTQEAAYGYRTMIQIFETALGMNLATNLQIIPTAIVIGSLAILIILIYGSLIIINSYSFEKKDSEIKKGLYGIFYKGVFSIFFFFTYYALPIIFACCIATFNCVRTKQNSYTLVYDSSMICYQGLHIGLLLIIVFSTLIFILTMLFFEIFISDSIPHSAIPWAAFSTTKNGLLKHLIKVIICIVRILDSNSDFYILEYIIIIIIAAILLYFLLKQPPFLYNMIGFTINLISCFTFSLCLSLLLIRCMLDVFEWADFGIAIAFSIIFSIFGNWIKSLHSSSYLTIDIVKQKDENSIIYFFYNVASIIDNANNKDISSIQKLYGMYYFHQMNCFNSNCYCHHKVLNQCKYEVNNTSRSEDEMIEFNQKYDSKLKQLTDSNIIFIKKWLQYLLNHIVSKKPKSFYFRILSSYYSSEYMDNVCKGVYETTYAQEVLKFGFTEEYLIYRYKKVYSTKYLNLLNKLSEFSGIENIIEFHKIDQIYRSLIRECTEAVMRFWTLLSSSNFQFDKLYQIGSNIATLYSKISSIYKKALNIYPKNILLLKMQGEFERLIINNDALFRQIEHQITLTRSELKELLKTINYGDPLEPNTINSAIAFTISGNPKKMGKIILVNQEVEKQLKYKAKELKGQNISCLMIDSIGEKHNMAIEKYINDLSQGMKIFKEIRLVIDANGYFHNSNYVVLISPNFLNELEFVVLMKLINYNNCIPELTIPNSSKLNTGIIVTSTDGNILGVSEACLYRFGIPSSIFSKRSLEQVSVNITELFPDNIEILTSLEFESKNQQVTLSNRIIKNIINKEIVFPWEGEYLITNLREINVLIQRKTKVITAMDVTFNIFWVYDMSMSLEEEKKDKEANPWLFENEETKQKNENEEQLLEEIDSASVSQSVSSNSSSNAREGLIKRVQNFKQGSNTKASSDVLEMIRRMLDIFMVVILATSMAVCVIIAIYFNKENDFFQSMQLIEDRVSLLARTYLSSKMIYFLNQTSSRSEIVGVDYFELLKEIGHSNLNSLGQTQTRINILKAQNANNLDLLENVNASTFQLYQVNPTANWISVKSSMTLNLVITQFIDNVNNFLQNKYEDYKTVPLVTQNYRMYLTFQKIYMESLLGQTYDIEGKFFDLKDSFKLSFQIPQYAISGVIAIIVFGCFIMLRLRIPQMQQSAKEVILIYSDITSEEIEELIKNGYQFQKLFGFIEESSRKNLKKNAENLITENAEHKLLKKPKEVQSPEKTQKGESPQENDPGEVGENEVNQEKSNEDENENENDKSESKVEKNAEDIQIEILKKENKNKELYAKKKKKIFETIKKGTFRFTILVMFLILFYILYYIVMIIIVQVANNKISLNISNLRSHFQTEYDILLSLVYGHELIESHTYQNSSFNPFDYYLDNILQDNVFVLQIISSSINEISDIQSILSQADTSQMCNILSSQLVTVTNFYSDKQANLRFQVLSNCSIYRNKLLNQGYRSTRAYIYKNLDLLRQNSGKYLWNDANMYDSVVMQLLYLTIIGQSIPISYVKLMDSYFNTNNIVVIVVTVGYIILVVIIQMLLKFILLKQNKEEVFRARGMLRIVPDSYVAKIAEMQTYKQLLQILNI